MMVSSYEESGQSFDLQFGRHQEIATVMSWLSNDMATTQFIAVTGIGGMGKSTLLSQMATVARDMSVDTFWLDGRNCTKTPSGFLDHLNDAIAADARNSERSVTWQAYFSRVSSHHRAVLFLDNLDALSSLEGWIVYSFIPRLPPCGLLVVTASRSPLSLAWRLTPAHHFKLLEIELGPFSRTETLHYLRPLSAGQETVLQTLSQATHGYPLAVGLAASMLQKQGPVSDTLSGSLSVIHPHYHNPSNTRNSEALSIPDQVAQAVATQLFREPIPDVLSEAIDVLSLTGVADHGLLNDILDAPLSPRAYHVLSSLSFIRNRMGYLALHDIVRHHLLCDFRNREPDRYMRLRTTTAQVLCRKASERGADRNTILSATLLTLFLDGLSLKTSYVDLTVSDDLYPIDFAKSEDLGQLLKILEAWRQYSMRPSRGRTYPRLISTLTHEFPRCIRVVRNERGKAIAMFVMVMVYEATASLLQEHFHDEMLECYSTEELLCHEMSADNYFGVLVGYSPEDAAGYAPSELIGALVRDCMRSLGRGTRTTLVATHPMVKLMLRELGFAARSMQSRICDTDSEEAQIFTLDLRNPHFLPWVFQRLRPDVDMESESDPLSDDAMIRDALAKFWDVAKLDRCRLANRLSLPGATLQALLRDMMTGDLPVSHLHDKHRRVLAAVYLEHPGNLKAASASLFMSRATTYRQLAIGIRGLRHALLHVDFTVRQGDR